jgi:UDP-glucose 4-epimerase
MKILVTGGAGFIGSHLAEALVAQGHMVHVLDSLYSGLVANVPPAATFVQLDIQDPEIDALFARERYDVVFHEAAQMDVRLSVADPAFDARVNILGTINLLEASRKYGVRKFIFASSGGAGYGEQEAFPADENHPIRPLSPYGITKVSVERYLFYYHEVFGLPYISLRYANVYGPRQNPHGEAGVVSIFCTKMLEGQQPVIYGDGGQTRDFVYVGDVISANLLALDYAGTGCFNVGTGIETSINEVFDVLNELLGGAYERKHADAKAGEQRRSVLDCQLITREMGWQPTLSFAEGMAHTLDWFRQQTHVAAQ